MPTIVHGNVLDTPLGNTLRIVLSSSFVFGKTHRLLVCGNGSRSLIKHYPSVAELAGYQVLHNYGHLGKFGFMGVSLNTELGFFQVKYHHKDAADLELIDYSANKLLKWIEYYQPYDHFDALYMDFPGLDCCNLHIKDIYESLKILPDFVHIYVQI